MTPTHLMRTVAVAALALAGCGEAPRAHHGPPPRPAAHAARPLGPRPLAVALGARLRTALRADAVLRQPRGEAADLGQPLPTTLVVRVTCRPDDGAASRCAAVLRRPSGGRRTVAYRVTQPHPGCLAAEASPALPVRYDPTINAASADPLGSLSSTSPACTGLPARPVDAGVSRPRSAGASGVAAQDPRDPRVPRVTPATLREPIARYRRHVVHELGAMERRLVLLRGDVRAGRLGAARAAWTGALAHYETIGAAYGAFGRRDAAIDGRPGGLPGGARSPRFTGLHRIELALWRRRSTRDAVRPTARTLADVRELRTAVAHGRVVIAPLDVALRAHEVLEDTLHLQLSGVASPWASAALVAARANAAGTRVLLDALDAPLRRRDPQRLTAARAALDRLDAVLDQVAPPGRIPRWDAVGVRDRARVDAAVADAAEELAYVPALADPRAPVARSNPFGPGGGS